MRFHCVVFDLDGTLVDSYQALATAVNRTLAHESRDLLTASDVRGLVGEGVEILLARCFDGEPATAERLDRFHAAYDEVCCEESVSLDGTRETLETLRLAGVTMAVCTNKPTHFSTRILDHLELSHFFASVVGPDLAGTQKPDGRHLQFTISRAGADAASALYVGDMPIDIATARACSIPVAVIASGSSSLEALQTCSPDYILSNFRELAAIVGGAP